ncbi:hypothetical protein JOD82_002103 [Paenibacillus sp. 1182]|uniref:hypothetical protein n=1 Tax=Paenibacillus sp. 1182 TaxID=2806565 RepID=UPI001AE56D23|nr:hypothetical protein [Paenibacillus sp. 1182]MBP1309083.1 hypothetical protein [Paenibacillus sp. 1182]
MKEIAALSQMVTRSLELGMNLPRYPQETQDIFELVKRKSELQKINQFLFKNESFQDYVEKNDCHQVGEFLDVDIRFLSTQKGFRFSARKFMICTVENESDIYKLVIPLNKENSELYLYGIVSLMEPSRMLEWSEYGFVSKSKLSKKEVRVHNKFAYSLEKGKNGEKEITAQEYFYLCLLEDAALAFLSKINNARLKNTNLNTQQLHLLRIWSVMKTDCFSQNHISISKPTEVVHICNEWEDVVSFIEWAIHQGYNDQIAMKRKDPMHEFSPSNCYFVSKNDRNCLAERYYWHYYNHFFYAASEISETPIVVNEVKRPLLEWAKMYNIPGHIIIGRVYSGLRDGDLIAPVIKKPQTSMYKEITIDGVTKSAKEWAEIAGIPEKTIISRLRYNWSGTDLIKPSGYRRK